MPQPRPKLFFSGHSYHQHTGSSRFFIELLESQYSVELYWDESWQEERPRLTADLVNASNPDVVVFYQNTPSRREIARIRCRNKIVVPMYDQVARGSKNLWRKLRRENLRAINFCQHSHQLFTEMGYPSMSVQYWPVPVMDGLSGACDSEALRILFWVRRAEVDWPVLKKLLGPLRPEKILLRTSPDPGENPQLPNATDQRDFNIEIIDGWLEKNEYLNLMKSCNVYMAPRLYEGIGMSFLEAMSYGLAVVAPNLPTMNEYMRHADNAYLYDPNVVAPINFAELHQVRCRTVSSVAAGHKQWLLQKKAILAFIEYVETRLGLFPRVLKTLSRR